MKKKKFLTLLLVIGLLISLFSVARSSASPGSIFQAAATRTAPLPRITATLPQPTRTPFSVVSTLAGKRPPQCTFPLAGIKPATVQPKTYTFLEPQVVLTSQTPLGVAEWLPDGEHLLITRDLPNSARQSIEVLNVRSGKTVKYAERDGPGKPFWLPDLQAVGYESYVWTNEKYPSVERTELWLSRGSTSQPERIAPDVFSASLSPDGKQIFFFSSSVENVLQKWSIGTRQTRSIPLKLEGPIYSETSIKLGKPIEVFWISPSNTRWIALYVQELLILANTQTGDVCEVALGKGLSGPNLATNVVWSTDGQYLAMTIGSGQIREPNHILIIDTVTGKQYQPALEVPFVFELAWMPNMHILTALGLVGEEQGRSQMGLFLLDVNRGYIERILPNWIFRSERGAMSWSPNGQFLSLDCTREMPSLEFRICITTVNAQR